MKSLKDILSYRNDNAISMFLRYKQVSEEEAEDVFCELLKFLWLISKLHKETLSNDAQKILPDRIIMDSSSIIDDMWHSFILCTFDYTSFCKEYFDEYIHHEPLDHIVGDHGESSMQLEEIVKSSMAYIYDSLGEETLVKWFEHYPEKFPPSN